MKNIKNTTAQKYATGSVVQKGEFLTLRAVRESSREVDFIASTDAIDAMGDSIAQNWRLDRYRQNPVVLFAHDSCSLPVGQATHVAVEAGKLVCTLKIATAAANPLAELVWQSVVQKTLRAVSVGFRPHTVRQEMRGDVDIWVLDDNELFEISVVPVPANAEALARGMMRSGYTPTPQQASALTAAIKAPQPERAPSDLGDCFNAMGGVDHQLATDFAEFFPEQRPTEREARAPADQDLGDLFNQMGETE